MQAAASVVRSDDLRSVIVNDPPAVFEFSKDQGEFAFRVVLFSLQSPTAEDDGCVF